VNGISVPFGPMVLSLAGAPAPIVSKRPGNEVDEPPQVNFPPVFEAPATNPEFSVQALYEYLPCRTAATLRYVA
jgi:hypothetical protein